MLCLRQIGSATAGCLDPPFAPPNSGFPPNLGFLPVMLSVEYLTAERRGWLDIRAAGEADVVEFFRIFGTVKDNQITTEAIQRATPELKERLAAFCAPRLRQAPKLAAFKKIIGDLRPNEAFLVLPAGQRTSAEIAWLEMVVRWANGEMGVEEMENYDRLFGLTLAEYDLVTPRTDRFTRIGEPQVSRRTCRFCHRTGAKGATFTSDAHAISRGLGNIHLKLAEECDECNGFFGKDLEPHLLSFLAIQRVTLGITGRSGLPKTAVRGGQMAHDGERIVIAVQADEVCAKDGVLTLEVLDEVSPVPERCYRTLVKFALSVIPEAELSHLSATVDWVRYGIRPATGALPPVYTAIVPLPPNPSAQLTLYVRRSKCSHLPHVVGEFRLGCYLYIFVLPFSSRNEGEPVFIHDERVLAVFPHYAAVKGWQSVDLSGTEPLRGPTLMRIAPQPSSASTMSSAPNDSKPVARTDNPASNSSSHSADDPT